MAYTYHIRSFDESTGIMVVDFDGWAKRVQIKLEPDANGNEFDWQRHLIHLLYLWNL